MKIQDIIVTIGALLYWGFFFFGLIFFKGYIKHVFLIANYAYWIGAISTALILSTHYYLKNSYPQP